MDQQTQMQQELAEIHALAKDTHRLMRAARRQQLIDFWGKIVIWLVLVGGSMYWFKVYVEPLVAQFRVGGITPGSLGLPTSTDIQNLINSYKAGQPK